MSCWAWSTPPTLDNLWTNQAHFVLDAENIPNQSFVRIRWVGNELWSYHWEWQTVPQPTTIATGRAVSAASLGSRCGLDWTHDSSIALPTGDTGRWGWDYNSSAFYHQVGRLESDGWSANMAQDTAGYLVYGPYQTVGNIGPLNAYFHLMVDNNTANNDTVAYVDVYNASTSQVLASRYVHRQEFNSAWAYQKFHLNFNLSAWNQLLEFRVYYYDNTYLKFQHAGVAEGNINLTTQHHWDYYLSSFPGVYKDGSTYYMVFEGAGYNGMGSNGDIGLAQSSDGITFFRNATNPILYHNTSGWESINIGTPSLEKIGSTWYLYYHGFNGSDCQIGLASGSNLGALSKYGSNPVLPTRSGTWEAGTTGKRSCLWQSPANGLYYMAYEGSTDANPDFGQSVWSTGFARSSNLVNWDRYAYNPVIPVTTPNPSIDGSGMGQDGPELVIINDSSGDPVTYLYVNTSCPTLSYTQKRYKLVWN